MMKEYVIVTKVSEDGGKIATVKLDKKTECAGCGMCAFPKNADSIEMKAENIAGAEVGDTVLIEREKDGRLFATLMVFAVPLLLIGLAALIALTVIKKEIWILLLSLIFLVSWYTILAAIDKKLQKTKGFSWRVAEIIKKGGENDDKGDSGESGI